MVLAHLCWLQLRLGSPLRQAYILATQSGSARIITTRPSEAFGQIARETGDGNVFLELAGCARTNRCFENSLGYFYFRANYALYPRQLYVAPAGAVINNGTDIMRAGFVPDRQWLQDHNIRSVLTYDGKDGGETPQLEFLQHDQHGAGIKANPAGGKPMALLACGFYLLLIVLVGYVVVSAIYPAQRMKAIQLATFSAAAGAGSTGLLLFWTSLAGFAPSRNLLLVIAGFALASLVALNKNGRLISADKLPGQSEKKEFWAIIPVSLILLALAVVATHSLLTPLEEWDAFAIWGLKAKVLAHAALRPVPPYFHDLSLSYSHLDYPLMLPFLTAGAYAAMGGADDQSGKLISVFLDVLVVPVVYLGLRWKLPRQPAIFLTAVLALLPAMFRYGGTGCADLPLAMFYAGSIFFAAKWLAETQWPDLLLAILFSSFTAFTKNEGLVLALANGVVILGFGLWRSQRHNRIGAGVFLAGLLVMNVAWLIWNHHLPKTHEDYGSKLTSTLLATHWPRLKQIIPALLVQATEPQVWGGLWLLAGVMALSGWRGLTRRYLLAVWILLALHLGSYVLAYIVTPWNLAVLMPETLERLLWHTMPAVFLLTGWHWAESKKSDGLKLPPPPNSPTTPVAVRPPCETSH